MPSEKHILLFFGFIAIAFMIEEFTGLNAFRIIIVYGLTILLLYNDSNGGEFTGDEE
jgi:hypothetical protein